MLNEAVILHSLPGRTRLRVQSPLRPVMIECFFRSLPGVHAASYTKETGTVLIYHDTSLSLREIMKYLKACIRNEKEKRQTSWKQYAAIATCTFIFAAHWIMGRNPAFWAFRPLLHKITVATAVLSTLQVIKDGIWNVIRHGKANANTLTAASIFASIYTRNPVSALVITIMSTISEMLSEHTSEKTKNYIRSVLELDTKYAWCVNETGIEEKVSIEDIKAGDTIVVFMGEKIPADGKVSEGYGVVDESAITGEYMPKEVTCQSHVYAGTILQSGQLKIHVEKAGDDTAASRIIHLLEEAQEKRAPIQHLADMLAERMVPVSFGLSLLTFLLTRDVNRAMNMLVIDFVCGIKLSTATALYASIGKAAKKGAIVKGSHHVEQMAQVNTVILDKTGTITEGSPVVQQVIPCEGYDKEEVIRLAAAAERNSSHPIADAILKQAQEWRLDIPNRDGESQVETVVGKGIRTFLNGKPIVVGSLRFMTELKVNIEQLVQKLERDENIIYVAYNQTLIGIISIFDKVRAGMHRAVQELRQYGVSEVVMLTGDKRAAAREMSRRLNLDWYHAEALPEDKATYVKQYRRNSTVMMVGDGINDAPALAYANIGVTMGAKRTDIASEASDIIITSDNPEMLSELVGLSKRTMQIIKQNFFATFFINGAAILLGALGIISPVVGAAIHNAATIGVVANSARILWKGDLHHGTKVLYSA
ncbi:heavy metal translocating P-type ATPase [Ectobacillus panaciterrae]|uniref:heavy metal translocating P-type ATPase n=1 Tax=Ectobacillus panaciterrae TaxID=363872 RepID=UPI00042604AC|nr:cation-translocating P-type ATPase [Ectobacillus panaciterrae]